MCGIVGYLGKKKKTKFLIEKLELLEYRGYDSAGYANLSDEKISFKKEVGSISELKSKIEEDSKVNCAIAHTRWATHGKVTETNSHPHLSSGEEWAVVHNGIIENYEELKLLLKVKPKSDTDTAVIAELLEEKMVKTISEFISVFDSVLGSFAIAAVCKSLGDSIFLAKRKSPLFVSKNEAGDFLIASDPICFKDFSNTYFQFEDDEFAEVHGGEIVFYDSEAKSIQKEPLPLLNLFETYGKNGYSTFMMKEIFEESESLKNQVAYYRSQNLLDVFTKEFISKFKRVKLIGCGTAHHASEIGAKYFKKQLGIDASADYASEFLYNEPAEADTETLFIFVSQSGETADTIGAMRLAKSKGATCIALTNVLYSTLAKSCDIVLPVCAGVEIAVASTKAYNCQLSSLYMLATHLKNIMFGLKEDYFEEILRVSDKILNFDKSRLDALAEKLAETKECIFIGKDMDLITAKEASLKLKETTYINSSAYPSGELKHGYLALVEDGTEVFAIACEDKLNTKTINSVKEAAARGAKSVIITNSSSAFKEGEVFFIDEKNELLLPILSITLIQYLSCKASLIKGINPDKPRNLAKSVTVE